MLPLQGGHTDGGENEVPAEGPDCHHLPHVRGRGAGNWQTETLPCKCQVGTGFCFEMFSCYIKCVVRCSNCSGWPVKVGAEFEPAKCGQCDEELDEETLDKYFKIKREIMKTIEDNQNTSIFALKYVHLMWPVFHPVDLTFIFMCQMALIESLQNDQVQNAKNMANILYEVVSKYGPNSETLKALRHIQKL